MASKKTAVAKAEQLSPPQTAGVVAPGPASSTSAPRSQRPSALVDTRVIYCGDNLEQLKKLAKQTGEPLVCAELEI